MSSLLPCWHLDGNAHGAHHYCLEPVWVPPQYEVHMSAMFKSQVRLHVVDKLYVTTSTHMSQSFQLSQLCNWVSLGWDSIFYVHNKPDFTKIGLELIRLLSILKGNMHLWPFVYPQMHRCVLNTLYIWTLNLKYSFTVSVAQTCLFMSYSILRRYPCGLAV